MTTATRRRAGATGQIGWQGRSHDAPDCGTYRLLTRTTLNCWRVQWTAACDEGRTSLLRFVSQRDYDRHF